MGFISKSRVVKSSSSNLGVTIPKPIERMYDLKKGDELEWFDGFRDIEAPSEELIVLRIRRKS